MKKEPMYKRYGAHNLVGVGYICCTFGINIYMPDEFDKYDCTVVASFSDGTREYGYHKHRVYDSVRRGAYIRKGGRRYYFDEILL